jgi:hypothetical protein
MQRTSPANRRYLLRMASAMAGYIVILFSVGWAYHHGGLPEGPIRYLIAAAPALPVFWAIWAMMRFSAEEEDEYQRHLHNRAIIASLGLVLAFCVVWGLLQSYAGAGPVNLIYVFDIYWVAQLLATLWVRLGAHR